jgi:lipopolysaccharide transport system permease protein
LRMIDRPIQDAAPFEFVALGDDATAHEPHERIAALSLFWHDTILPLTTLWHNRDLVIALTRHELGQQFNGALLGWAWAIAGPLVTLVIYLVTFTSAIKLPVASAQNGREQYALTIFVGLIVFNFCAETFYRAPNLLHERAWQIKTSIFPTETLAAILVARGLSYAGIGVALLLGVQLLFNHHIPPSVVLLPLVTAPLILLVLGVVWLLAALGAFARDVGYLMVYLVPVLMFVTPVFYQTSDISDRLQTLVYFGSLAVPIEMMRAVLLGDSFPPFLPILWFVVFSCLVFRAGFSIFMRYKGILADVI